MQANLSEIIPQSVLENRSGRRYAGHKDGTGIKKLFECNFESEHYEPHLEPFCNTHTKKTPDVIELYIDVSGSTNNCGGRCGRQGMKQVGVVDHDSQTEQKKTRIFYPHGRLGHQIHARIVDLLLSY